MALIRPPIITILAAVKATWVAADLVTQLDEILTELGGGVALPLKFRWLRNRYATNEEKPCQAIAFVSDGPRDSREGQTYGEQVRELAIDLITDIEIPTEVEADEEATIADIAGLEILSHFDRRAVQALRAGFGNEAAHPTPLNQVATWVEELGVDDDEDLVDFNGRLASRLIVQYRVRSDDLMVLLAPGG